MRILFLLLSVILGVAATGAAHHCEAPSATPADVSTENHLGLPVYYIDEDFICQLECWGSVWVYQESNGVAGLQRADENANDTCHGMIQGDTLVF